MRPLVEPGPALSPAQITRYSRQLMLPGFGEDAQRRLAAARVVVIGAGGLGSAVVPALAAAGVGQVVLIDDDVVEPSNLHRQLAHGTADVGRAKVDSLADSVAAIAPGCRVETHAVRATADTLPPLLDGAHLLIDGSDNFPTRYLANDAAELRGIPLVWGSIFRFHGQVGVAWRAHGPTYRDLFPVPPPADDTLSCELGGVLPMLCGTIGALLATEAVKLIAGLGEPLIGRVLSYDALIARTREIAYAAADDVAPITGLIDYDRFCGVASAETTADGAATVDGAAPAISAADLLRMLRAGEPVRLVDVREPHEASVRRIETGELLPLAALQAGTEPAAGTGRVVVYCEQDPRSRRAVAVLRERGYDALYLAGGIRAFAAIGGEVVS